MRLLAPVTGFVLGTAAWASLGVVDQVPVDGVMTRVAMLPSWPVWAVLTAAAVAAISLLDRRVAPGPSSPAAGWYLPLLCSGVLLVPYLPWVADRWPLWQMLAGPLRWIVWTAIAGQLAWVAWQHGWLRPRPALASSLGAATLVVGFTVLAASGWAAWRLSSGTMFPTGDEPHYLVIAQSLWRDGDLKIENNHQRGDYREYFGGTLDPHYITRGADDEIYSIHPVGMPVLIAPVYAAGGYPLVVAFFVLMSTVAAVLVWRASVRWLRQSGAATFGLAAVVAGAPFLLNTLTIYPEIPAALAVALAFTLTRRDGAAAAWLIGGVAVAALPWLSTKYAPMSAALVAVLAGRAWLDWRPWPRLAPSPHAWRASLLVAGPYVLSLAGWFAFFQIYWGIPSPTAPYGALTQTEPAHLLFGAPGLLFDQEYGLLPYAPALVLAAPGLWRMTRGTGAERRLAVEILLVFGALVATVGAFRIWWGGSAVVGRPVVSGLLLLALPIAVQFASAPAGSARRAAQHLLVWVGGAVTVMLVAAQEGLLVGNYRDGTSSLVMWLSPRWELWTRLPTFVLGHTDVGAAWIMSLAWVAVAVIAGVALARIATRAPGRAAFTALGVLTAALLTAVAVTSWLPAPVPQPAVALEARTEIDTLHAFDRHALPIAVVYDPLRMVAPERLLTGVTLAVEPGQRTDPQPIPLLHNGRFSLPAGRYALTVHWADEVAAARPVEVPLQVGRSGPPWQAWRVTPEPGGTWTAAFDLPVDALLVGLRRTPALLEAVTRVEIRPTEVVDVSLRPATPDVTGAARFADVSVFFHDGVTHGEPTGFWALGARVTTVTVVPAHPGTPVEFRLHSGGGPNRVTLETRGWQETFDLTPGVVVDVTIPPSGEGAFALSIDAEDGFVPAEVDPASRDQRRLGAWFELPPVP